MSYFIVALGSLLIVAGAGVQYLSTIPRGKVPKSPIGLVAFVSVGMLLSAYSIFLNIAAGKLLNYIGVVPAVLAIVLGSGILWLLMQRKTPLGNIKVKAGDSMLPFTASYSDGTSFNSEEFLGKRILFKFFRGGWCPYCSAELKLFEKMLPELEKYNVSVVALSNDSVAQATTHKARDKISFPLLSDPKLETIMQYGVEHHKAIGGRTVAFTLFGVPLAFDLRFKSMAIPTSLLIDEKGIIQWIDQSEDYRLRASEATVLKAVETVFGEQAKLKASSPLSA